MYLITRHHNRVSKPLNAARDPLTAYTPRFKSAELDLAGSVLIRTLRVVRRILSLGEHPHEYIREVVTPAVVNTYLTKPTIDWSRDQALLNEGFIPTTINGVFTIMVDNVPLAFSIEGNNNVQ